MDMLTADVTEIGDVNPGDEVVFLGSQGDDVLQHIDAREMASAVSTIPYEISPPRRPWYQRAGNDEEASEAQRLREETCPQTGRCCIPRRRQGSQYRMIVERQSVFILVEVFLSL